MGLCLVRLFMRRKLMLLSDCSRPEILSLGQIEGLVARSVVANRELARTRCLLLV